MKSILTTAFAMIIVAAPLSVRAVDSAPSKTETDTQPKTIRFNRDVLPILAENCFACHGFDESSRQADLRLDTRDGATATKDGVATIVPGKPKSSELIRRIQSTESDEVMPPPGKHGKHLTVAQ